MNDKNKAFLAEVMAAVYAKDRLDAIERLLDSIEGDTVGVEEIRNIINADESWDDT